MLSPYVIDMAPLLDRGSRGTANARILRTQVDAHTKKMIEIGITATATTRLRTRRNVRVVGTSLRSG